VVLIERPPCAAQVVFEGEIRPLMQSEGLSEAAIKAFQQNYEALVRGDDGMIAERAITPAADLPSLADIAQTKIPEDKVRARPRRAPWPERAAQPAMA